MGGLFSGPSTPPPQTPPPPPTIGGNQAAMNSAALAQQQAMARGYTSTILTSGAGLSNMGQASTKQLLGQ